MRTGGIWPDRTQPMTHYDLDLSSFGNHSMRGFALRFSLPSALVCVKLRSIHKVFLVLGLTHTDFIC